MLASIATGPLKLKGYTVLKSLTVNTPFRMMFSFGFVIIRFKTSFIFQIP